MKKLLIIIGAVLLCTMTAFVYLFVSEVHESVDAFFGLTKCGIEDHTAHADDGHDHDSHAGHHHGELDEHDEHEEHEEHDEHGHEHADEHEDHAHCEDGTCNHEECKDHDHDRDHEEADHDHEDSSRNSQLATRNLDDHDHEEADHDHDHDLEEASRNSHSHAGHHHVQVMTLTLSKQALANIGIENESGFGKVEVGKYDKTLSFPAMIEEQPGATLTKVPSPVGGIITKIYYYPGQMIQKGQPLFEIRLTREDVIAAQANLLTLIQKRDIILKEEERLGGLEEGLAPQAKRDIAFQKLENEAALSAQKSMLILNGLPVEEVENKLLQKHEIISNITVYAPTTDEDCLNHEKDEAEHCQHHHQLDTLYVQKGQSVAMGDPLCQISDMDQLLIRGSGYAYNNNEIYRALEHQSPVCAVFTHSGIVSRVEGLKIRNISNRVDSTARTMDFFVEIENVLEQHDEKSEEQNPYLSWKLKPGQRCQLEVTYDTIENCIIVPVWAIAREQANCYVFELSGTEGENKTLIRRPVHVLVQTQTQVVISNDGSIKPGATIALRGASQLQIALDAGGGKLQSACPCGNH